MPQLKKLSLLIFWLLFSATVPAQTTVRLNGTIQNATTYLQFSSPYFSDFVQLAPDGRFEIAFVADTFPVPLEILAANASGRITSQSPTLWLVAAEHQLTLDAAKKNMTYTVSPLSPEQELSDRLQTAKADQFEQLLQKNAGSLVAVYTLHKRKLEFSPAKLQTLLTHIPASARATDYYQAAATYTAAKLQKTPKKGEIFQTFAVKDTKGNKVDITPNHDKYRLLAILSPSCSYSLESISVLNELKNIYGKKMDIIGVWSADGEDDLKPNYRSQLQHANWQRYWDSHAYADTYFALKTSPTFLLINPEGRIEKIIKGLETDQLKSLSLP